MKKIFCLLFFLTLEVFAHQPKLTKNSSTQDIPYAAVNPEVPKAYYGKLTGKAHFYKI